MLIRMATLRGELSPWPTRDELVQALRAGGLSVLEGRCCVVVKDCEYFVFERYSPVCGPYICADASDEGLLMDDARRVSTALAQHGIRHRFTVIGHEGALVEYLHHDWPFADAGDGTATLDVSPIRSGAST